MRSILRNRLGKDDLDELTKAEAAQLVAYLASPGATWYHLRMTTAELVGRLLEFGRANAVESLTSAGPYLDALAAELGDREVRSVTARDLSDFHRGAGAELAGSVMSRGEEQVPRLGGDLLRAVAAADRAAAVGEREPRQRAGRALRPAGLPASDRARAGLRRRRQRRLHGDAGMPGDRRRRLSHRPGDGAAEGERGRGGGRVRGGRRLRARAARAALRPRLRPRPVPPSARLPVRGLQAPGRGPGCAWRALPADLPPRLHPPHGRSRCDLRRRDGES